MNLSRLGQQATSIYRVSEWAGSKVSCAASALLRRTKLQSIPTLTTMTNPASELTRLAAEMLKELLDGNTPHSPPIVPSHLVIRDSA